MKNFVWLSLVVTTLPLQAHATTLKELLDLADVKNVDRRISAAQQERASAEFGAAWSALLPSFAALGTWTNNQYPAEVALAPGVDPIVITPENQLDAVLRFELPLIDTGRWFRAAAASSNEDAADFRNEAMRDTVRRQVATTYYGYAAALALSTSAQRSLAVAEAQEQEQIVRSEAGSSTKLDLLRAKAEVERNRQTVADAEQLVANSRRALRTLTGVELNEDAFLPKDDLEMVGTLEQLEGKLDDLPTVKAADQDALTADRLATASKLAIVPVVTANFTERLTNATGFIGQSDSYTAGVGLAWPLNVPLFFNMSSQSSTAEVQALVAERQRQDSRDQIHRDWQRLRASIEKVKAAQTQVEATRRASEAAHDRYAAGAATQIDVIQAERDLFASEVSQVQARTELASSQVSLRISAGLPLNVE